MSANGLQPYPAYRESGLDWLGRVPDHWAVRRLKGFAKILNGATPASGRSEYWGGDILWMTPEDLGRLRGRDIHGSRRSITRVGYESCGTTLAPVGSTVVSTRAPIGHLAILGREGCTNQGCRLLVPESDAVVPEWAYLGLLTARSELQALGRGTTFAELSRDALGAFALPLPPLPEQRAIARFLKAADRRIRRYIRAKERLIELLEERKRALIHEAVTGRIDVRTGQPYPAYKDSGVEWLGKVPEHWEVRRLGQLIDLTVGFPFKSDGFTQARSDIRLLRGVNIAPGTMRWDDVVRWPTRDVDSSEDYEMEVGDIVLGMDRPIIQAGIRVAVVSASDVPSLLLQRVARIRVKEALRGDYAVELIGGKGFSNYLAPIFTGISVPHLSAEQIKTFRFALPNVAEQLAIMHHVESRTRAIRSATARILQQVHLLREYRTRLIADVVTGKLDVREAPARLPETDPLAGDRDPAETIPTESNLHSTAHDMAKEASA